VATVPEAMPRSKATVMDGRALDAVLKRTPDALPQRWEGDGELPQLRAGLRLLPAGELKASERDDL
jgi:hypothetical protein